MNVYDFDDTIYKGDSTVDFYKFALKRKPRAIIYIFAQSWALFLYVTGFYSKTKMKEKFHSYLNGINNVNKLVEEFWSENISGINKWYIDQKKDDDIIITASPDFIVRPACKLIGINNVIATLVDPKTGVFLSENNREEEKVSRFLKEYEKAKIENFYSDSLSDEPMAKIAQKSYFVKENIDIIPWKEYKPSVIKRFKSFFFQREFIMYVIVGFINAVNGVLFAWLLSFAIQANIAYAVGYILAVVLSFFINSLLTFKKRPSLGRFWRFCFSYLPSFIIQNLSVLLLYNSLGAPKLIAYIAAAIIGIPLTFLFMKLFAFRQ